MRRELRYRLEVPTLFSWQSDLQKQFRGEGFSRDLSALGAFIVTSTCPPVETPVQIEIVLPSLTGGKSVIRIIGEARVVRVEHPSGGHGENGFALVRGDLDQRSLTVAQDDSEFILAVDMSMPEKPTLNSGN